MAAVAADGEGGWNLYWTIGRGGADTGSDSVSLDEAGGLPPHARGEGREAGCFCGEEVEEVPLGHECYEFGVGGEVGEIRHLKTATADDGGEPADLRVRQGEEFFE